MAGRWMAQPVYPQLRKYASVPALTLRAISGKAPIEQNRSAFPRRAEVVSTPHG
jgi:hypothetical protein